jgi:hypothetical protein
MSILETIGSWLSGVVQAKAAETTHSLNDPGPAATLPDRELPAVQQSGDSDWSRRMFEWLGIPTDENGIPLPREQMTEEQRRNLEVAGSIVSSDNPANQGPLGMLASFGGLIGRGMIMRGHSEDGVNQIVANANNQAITQIANHGLPMLANGFSPAI